MPVRDHDFPVIDDTGLRITDRLERAVIRLRLASQGEFISIINAIQMQLESGTPTVPVIARLTEAVRELALARGVDLARTRIGDHLDQLVQHLRSRTTQTR